MSGKIRTWDYGNDILPALGFMHYVCMYQGCQSSRNARDCPAQEWLVPRPAYTCKCPANKK